MKAFASLVVLITSILIPSLSHADEPKGDLAKLQGTWSGKVGQNKEIPVLLTIKESAIELKFTRPDQREFKIKGELKLDEKPSPKELDWVKLIGPGDRDLPTIKLIYKLDGDNFTTCSAGPDKDRPTKFEAGDGTPGEPTLDVWTRVKPEEKAPKSDLDKFQGTWTAPAGPNDEVVITMTVKDKTYTASWDRGDGTNVELKGEIKLDDKASPKQLDFFKSQRNDGEDARDNLGIYAFDGENLKVCVGMPGNERPTEFKKGDDGAPMLLNFTKKKD